MFFKAYFVVLFSVDEISVVVDILSLIPVLLVSTIIPSIVKIVNTELIISEYF